MKKAILKLLLITLPVLGFSQQKITLGTSAGIIRINDDDGFNTTFNAGYKLNEAVTLGIDAMFGKSETTAETLKSRAFMGYTEIGNPGSGLFNNKLYFSWKLGVGYLEYESDFTDKNSFTFYGGSKVNLNLHKNIMMGINTGLYVSRIKDPLIGNVFVSYSF